MRRRKYDSSTSFLDLLFNLLVGVVFLFVVAFLLISADKKASIETKAEFVITLTWDKKSKSDVDIWVEDPLGNIVFFRNKEKGMVHLDRDDLGVLNDEIILPNGDVINYEFNQEILTIRGFVPGEWTVNVHLYKKREAKPIKVKVEMIRLNPIVKTIMLKTFLLMEDGQEVTVTRFEMTSNGRIFNWNDLPKKLVRTKMVSSYPSYLPGSNGRSL